MGNCLHKRDIVSSEVFPEEVIFSEILPKLPVESLIRSKSVSKVWRDFITKDAMLKKAQARHLITSRNSGGNSIIAFKKKNDKSKQKLVLLDHGRMREFETPRELKDLIFKDIMSSNGLVLVSKPLMLWNPATKEFRVLPEPLADKKVTEVLGLGFNEESGDHKVVRVTRDQDLRVWSLYLQVFSKRAGSWKKLRPVHGFVVHGARVSSEEAIYFLAWERHLPRLKASVMSFTYRNDEVRKVTDGPDCCSLPNKRLKLVRWKEDSLALFSRDQVTEKLCDFWVMTEKDGDDEGFCWSKIFVFDCYNDIGGICGVWSDQILISRKRKTELTLLDSRYGNCLVLAELNKPLCYFGVFTHYVPTLLSVYSDP